MRYESIRSALLVSTLVLTAVTGADPAVAQPEVARDKTGANQSDGCEQSWQYRSYRSARQHPQGHRGHQGFPAFRELSDPRYQLGPGSRPFTQGRLSGSLQDLHERAGRLQTRGHDGLGSRRRRVRSVCPPLRGQAFSNGSTAHRGPSTQDSRCRTILMPPSWLPGPSLVETGSLISTSFTAEVGQTVVVGSSRLNGGDDALIVLFTALP